MNDCFSERKRIMSLNILHLEPDPIDAQLTFLTLKASLACDIEQVSTFDELCEALKDDAFDVVISEYQFSNGTNKILTGDRVLNFIKAECPTVPLVFVSKVKETAVALQMLEKGAADYVFKEHRVHLAAAVKDAVARTKSAPKQKKTSTLEFSGIAPPTITPTVVSKTDTVTTVKTPDPNTSIDFQMLVERLSDTIVLLNAQGEIRYVSPALERDTGFAPSEVLGKSVWAWVHPDDVSLAKRKLARLLADPHRIARISIELRVKHKNGDWCLFSVRGTNELANPAISGIAITMRDITERRFLGDITRLRNKVLGMLASGEPLAAIMNVLCHSIESRLGGALCSVLLVKNGRVYSCAAPSLPEAFSKAINGEPIGDRAGSCGTAAFRKARVIVEDIATSPLWENYAALAAQHQLRACWSTPIFNRLDGDVIATFALYYKEPHQPTTQELQLVDSAVDIASLAIQRAETEEKLRLSEEHLSQTVRYAPIGITTKDLNGRYRSANPAFCRIVGYTAEELLEASYAQFTHPDDIATEENLNAKLLSGILPDYEMQKRYIRKDGSVVHTKLHVGLIRDMSGNPVEFVCEVEDITEQLAAQQALLRSEEQYRMLVDNMRDGVFLVQDARIQFVNQAMAEMLGYDPEQLIDADFRAIVAPEEVDVVARRYQARIEGLLAPREYETCLLHKDGHRITVMLNVSLIEYRGRAATTGTVRDITDARRTELALQKAEANLRATFDSTITHLVFLDTDFTVQTFNKAAADHCKDSWGRDLTVGDATFNYIRPKDLERYKAALERALAGETVRFERQSVGVASGIEKWFDTIFAPVRDDNGMIIGVCYSAVDITERKRVDAALKDSEAKLKAILDSGSHSVLLIDKNYFIQAFNKSAVTWANIVWKRSISIGESIFNFANPDDIDELQRHLDAALAGETIQLERIIKGIDGEGRWFEIEFVPVVNSAGDVEAICFTASNIDERKRAALLVEKSEERFRALAKNSSDLTVVINDKRKLTYVSESVEKQLGYKPDELIDTDAFTFVHPDDTAAAMDAFINVIKNADATVSIEFRYKRADGTYATLSAIASNHFNVPSIAGAVVNIRDVTAQKQVEEKLRLQAGALDQMSEAIVAVNLQGRITYLNPAAEKFYGIRADDAVGMKSEDLMKYRYPSMKARQDAKEKLEQGGTWQGEVVYADQQGERILSISLTKLKDQNGKPAGLLTVQDDITAKKKSEETLRIAEERLMTVITNAPIILFALDEKGVFTLYEGKGLENIGRKPKEFIGKSIYQLYPRSSPIFQAFQRALSGDLVSEVLDVRGAFFETYIRALFNTEGNVIGAIGVAVDVTEKKKSESERERLETQLMQAQKMEAIGTLTGGIAHDFNNLLAVILGNIELMRYTIDKTPELQKPLSRIDSAASRAASLTKQLLSFARKGKFNPQPLNINRPIESVLNIISHTIDRRIDIETHLTPNLPAILGDENQLEQVFMNLAVNAIDAMQSVVAQSGNAKLVITSELLPLHATPFEKFGLSSNKNYIHVVVSDTGEGIAPDIQEKVFDPFFTTKEVGKGTGLGLSTVYGIVKSHQGTIELDSQVGKGTLFHLYFPALADVKEAPPAAKPQKTTIERLLQLLVIEDEEMVREYVCDLLASEGHNVLLAENGIEGISVFNQHHKTIDLVLLDMNMPQFSGEDTFYELQRIKPDVKVILVTGYANEQAVLRMLEKGLAGVLTKPYEMHDLLDTISQVLNQDT